MDKQNVRSGGRTAIEFCDMFGSCKTKIHVKKGATSSELSHLFQQGTVSAELLADDQLFRDGVRSMLDAVVPNLKRYVPTTKPKTSEYEIVFAIIDNRDKSIWPKNLPFFSQVTLRNCHKYLTGMGYKVSIKKIEIGALPLMPKVVVRKK